MNSKASEIFALFNPAGILESLDGDAQINAIQPVETGKSGCLVFIDNKKFLPFVKENKPSAVVTNKDLISEIQSLGGISCEKCGSCSRCSQTKICRS